MPVIVVGGDEREVEVKGARVAIDGKEEEGGEFAEEEEEKEDIFGAGLGRKTRRRREFTHPDCRKL